MAIKCVRTYDHALGSDCVGSVLAWPAVSWVIHVFSTHLFIFIARLCLAFHIIRKKVLRGKDRRFDEQGPNASITLILEVTNSPHVEEL